MGLSPGCFKPKTRYLLYLH